ncbi:UDP-glucose 4-epimerase GalE [Allorhizocola rhizosphaerae]|uniref:UDP-glucose 4-epimerase GalE n=1 Tax=Allorhizocola rhizosphaerae TaxID=1872709 RepID=UPI000E3BCB01|nr:UDP-glucose 4-epimerase GalE [Allorhizocola rhizosphaerae]
MKVLVTGGAGYIGSTVASALLDSGHTPVILDNLVTGRRAFTAGRVFYEGDVADGELLDRVFADHPDIEVAVHCAALIVVPESVKRPLNYYRENVAKTISLVEHLTRNDCRRLLFSSSASIYRPGPDFSVDESSPVEPTSPYAHTKAMIDTILADAAHAGELRAISLRYFNPVGADPKMRTGLQTLNPTHALGKMIEAWENGTVFPITGTDWPTRDGSGIRDYIHVWDLARAHVAALEKFDSLVSDHSVINLGTGNGTTVRELLDAFEEVTGAPLAHTETDRRPGDAVGAFARSLRKDLGWTPELTIIDGIRDALAWRAKLLS